MASDISSIVKNEISNTLESLLSVTSNIEDVVLIPSSDFEETQYVACTVDFDFSNQKGNVIFYIPTETATQFEYLMLGGVTDLKKSIDDEITDAIKEIISTISGSMCTSINAQSFTDLSNIKSTLLENKVVASSEITTENKAYKFIVKLNDDNLDVYMSFDSTIAPFVALLTSEERVAISSAPVTVNEDKSTSIISSLLGEESVDNLRLLFEIKMRLSVRLGTKVCLLRDVISWDVGEIIELSQMTNEPLDILVNGIVIGTGEAIIVDGKFGIKIKQIGKIK